MSEFLIVVGGFILLGRLWMYDTHPELTFAETVNAWQTWLGLSMMLAGAVLAKITEQWKKGHSPLERPNNENGGI